MKDKVISCQDCKQEFVFSLGEQGFYKEKGLNKPIRCGVCRATFKAASKDKFRGRVKQ